MTLQISGSAQINATLNNDTFDHDTDGVELLSRSGGTIYAIISNGAWLEQCLWLEHSLGA